MNVINISVVRAKCFLIVQGLERSIVENILESFDVDDPHFLSVDEQAKALNRIRDFMEDSEWELDDVTNEDLLPFLDTGDLIGLLNRHRSSARNTTQMEIRAATRLMESKSLPTIRNRVMHTIRPLEADDLATLMEIANGVQPAAPSLNWQQLVEGIRLAQSPEGTLDVKIPPFWAEEPTILHNLPPAEFDDSGFIGRERERRKLRNLLESDHSVITVVGSGGVGKTALALRVCHDILDDPSPEFERVVWVSLKTQYLTTDGIRDVIDAVDTTDILVDRLLSAISISTEANDEPTWDRVLEQMKANKILLIIDNLETLGSEIRDLAVSIPRNSKLLLTSRVGLGEIELRYDMPELSTVDSVKLLRNLGVAYNYSAVIRLQDGLMKRYCDRLHNNPLLIKWFVQAVGKGTRPEDVLANEEMRRALQYCWENVYNRLSELAVEIISTLLAARQTLSQTQLQALCATSHVAFVLAMQELHQSNIVERSVERNGTTVYQIGSLVFDYLSQFHPPDNRSVMKVRNQLRQWQTEQDRSAVQQQTYRYNRRSLVIGTNDQRIAAPHLRNALNAMRSHDGPVAAHKSIERAQELTPQWWEVYRVKAQVLEQERRPIYEVEQAYEESIRCEDIDINRFHYAVYLMGISEYERALDQIERAAAHMEADDVSLRSVKGLVLLRSGRIPEALEELEYVWNCEDAGLPINIKRVHGTQLAGALRRRVEQLYQLGDTDLAESTALRGITVTDDAAKKCGWDWKLAEEGFRLLAEAMGRYEISSTTESAFTRVASKWDQNSTFRDSLAEARRNRTRTQTLFERSSYILSSMPNSKSAVPSSSRARLVVGRIDKKMDHFGFIRTETLGSVHMNRSSLVKPRAWRNLKVGQKVIFLVEKQERGPHALELELYAESNDVQ